MRVISWNLNGAVDDRARRQAQWMASQDPDLVLVQEASTRMLTEVAALTGLPVVHGADPPANRRQRSVAVLTRLRPTGGWMGFAGTAMPHVALGSTLLVDGVEVDVWSYHAPNGSAYGQEKVRHAEAMANRLAGRTRPVLVGSDLNTPVVDPPDARFIRTHWQTPSRLRRGEPTDAVLCGAPATRVHDLDDALRIYAREHPEVLPAGAPDRHGPLAVSYRTRRRDGPDRSWRLDIVWVSPEFSVSRVDYATQATLQRGMSDHAAVIVEVHLS